MSYKRKGQRNVTSQSIHWIRHGVLGSGSESLITGSFRPSLQKKVDRPSHGPQSSSSKITSVPTLYWHRHLLHIYSRTTSVTVTILHNVGPRHHPRRQRTTVKTFPAHNNDRPNETQESINDSWLVIGIQKKKVCQSLSVFTSSLSLN